MSARFFMLSAASRCIARFSQAEIGRGCHAVEIRDARRGKIVAWTDTRRRGTPTRVRSVCLLAAAMGVTMSLRGCRSARAVAIGTPSSPSPSPPLARPHPRSRARRAPRPMSATGRPARHRRLAARRRDRATGAVGDTLGDVVDAVVEPVVELLEPAHVAPSPSSRWCPRVEAVTDTVERRIGGGNRPSAPSSTRSPARSPASRRAARVDPVAAPSTACGRRHDRRLPLVGGLLGDGTVSGVVGPVTGLVDDTLGTVVGSTGELPPTAPACSPASRIPLLPGVRRTVTPAAGRCPAFPASCRRLRTPASPPPTGGRAARRRRPAELPPPDAARRRIDAGVRRIGPADAGAPPGGGPPAPAGSRLRRHRCRAAGGASGTSDAAFAALELDALASLALHSVDDALPSSPVFDTDSTPD